MEEATKLRCRNDHYETAAWKIKGAPDGKGFFVYVACELGIYLDDDSDLCVRGDHYLAPGAVSQLEPYVWPDSRAAWAAVGQWNQEHQP